MPRALFCIRNPNPGERERLEAAGCTPHDCLERCRRCVETAFVVIEDDHRNRTVVEDTLHDNIIRKLPQLLQDAESTASNP